MWRAVGIKRRRFFLEDAVRGCKNRWVVEEKNISMFVRLQIFKGICVGRASRLTQKDPRPQASGLEPTPRKARRRRYISEG